MKGKIPHVSFEEMKIIIRFSEEMIILGLYARYLL